MALKTSSERLADAMARTRRHWQMQLEMEKIAMASPPEPMPPPAFSIAISREAGADGGRVARALGEQLNWPVYDRELVELLAERMGVRSSLIAGLDEQRSSWIRECLAAFSADPPVVQAAYVRRLVETLLALAAHGSCVLVGRGAAQVLPPATTLRVRLVAPLAHRIDVLRDRNGLTRDEAERRVATTDRDRTRFVQDHFRIDPVDPHTYDLILNSARFDVTECADLIVAALRRLQGRAGISATAPPGPRAAAVAAAPAPAAPALKG